MSSDGPGTYRVGIAGAGIGARYARSFQTVPGVEVVAICAASRERSEPAAGELGIPAVYTSFEAMLAECGLDVVVVATPNDLHHSQTLAAIEAGAHVVCDKPLALDSAQARDLLDAATRRGVRTIIPFWLRFVPALVRARELLAGGSLGPPAFVDVRFLNCGWGDPEGPMRWQFERARAGSGALSNIGSHAIDALHWLGGDVRRICATTAITVGVRHWPDGREARPDADDTAAFVAELANGAPVCFLASHVAYTTRSAFSLAVHCRAGSVTISLDTTAADPRGHLTVMRRGDEAPHDEPLPASAHAPANGGLVDGPYNAIARELIDAIRERRAASPDFADGLRVQDTIDAALASVASGGWAAVPAGGTGKER
jgi:predicted dehydrogenase